MEPLYGDDGTEFPPAVDSPLASRMFLRDYFAGQAMANLLMDPWYTDRQGSALHASEIAPHLAVDAYTYADAMLAARTQGSTTP